MPQCAALKSRQYSAVLDVHETVRQCVLCMLTEIVSSRVPNCSPLTVSELPPERGAFSLSISVTTGPSNLHSGTSTRKSEGEEKMTTAAVDWRLHTIWNGGRASLT